MGFCIYRMAQNKPLVWHDERATRTRARLVELISTFDLALSILTCVSFRNDYPTEYGLTEQ